MTIVTEHILICDGPACRLDETYADGDARHNQKSELLRAARLDGWRRVKGKDYCPDCYNAEWNNEADN